MRGYCADELEVNVAACSGVWQGVGGTDMVCIKHDQTASGTKDAVSLRQHGSSIRNVAWEEVGCERWRVS